MTAPLLKLRWAFNARGIPSTRIVGTLARHIFRRDRTAEIVFQAMPRVAVLGPHGTGRSTLVNALLGREAVPYGEGSATRQWTEASGSERSWATRSPPRWPQYVCLVDGPGAGVQGQDATIPWPRFRPDGVLLVLHPSREQGSDETIACRTVAAFQQQGIPVFAVLNAVDTRQHRHALDLNQELDRQVRRLDKEFSLTVDGIGAIAARDALVAMLVIDQRDKLGREGLAAEFDQCLRREDLAAACGPARSLLARSGLKSTFDAFDAFAQRHLLQPWAKSVLHLAGWSDHDLVE